MTKFVIFGTPRSGTTFLVTLLDSHPEILCIGEAFKDYSGPIAHAEFSFYNYRTGSSDKKLIGYLNYIYTCCNSRKSLPGKIFMRLIRPAMVKKYLDYIYSLPGHNAVGFKFHYEHSKRFPAAMNYFRSNNIKIIHIVRLNILKKYLSLIKARKTGIYATGKNLQPEKIFIPPDKLIGELEHLSEEDKLLESCISTLPSFKIEYEQLADMEKRKEINSEMLRFLGVNDSIQLTSNQKKINPDRIEDIIENYDEISALLKGSQYKWCLD